MYVIGFERGEEPIGALIDEKHAIELPPDIRIP